jgi:hypothetical protein
LALLAGAPGAFALLSAGTYRPWADGSPAALLRQTLLVAAGAVVVYGALRLRLPVSSRWPLLALAVALAAGGSAHAVRLAHPVARGFPFLAVHESFDETPLPARWEVASEDGATIAAESGAVTLDVPAGATAWLGLPTPEVAWWLRGPSRWWLPAGFNAAQAAPSGRPGQLDQSAERLSWRASIERRGRYFVVLDTDVLLVQAAAYGLHLTWRAPDGDVKADEVSAMELDSSHEWRLRRDPRWLALDCDGVEVWARPATGPLGRIRFGETRADPAHGGRLTLSEVTYARWWDHRPS